MTYIEAMMGCEERAPVTSEGLRLEVPSIFEEDGEWEDIAMIDHQAFNEERDVGTMRLEYLANQGGIYTAEKINNIERDKMVELALS